MRQFCIEIDRILIYDNLKEYGINNASNKAWDLSHKHTQRKQMKFRNL